MTSPSIASPLRAALYARKSTDQNLPDSEKSVRRQIEHATTYAQRKGWIVLAEHVYMDESISGADFVKRRGFLALMNTLKPRPPFDVLVTMDQSRLGRSLDEVPYAIKRITDAGVRIFCYLTDSEVKRDSAADKFMIHAIAFVDDMHRQQSRERTHDALRRKMLAGHVTGGGVYGYRNVEVRSAQGQRLHVHRVIVPEQATVLRRIFEAVAAGQGFGRIAKALNRDGVPAPRAASWAPTCLRAMLHRELYQGRVVWNQTGWVDRNGTKVKVDRPESEWLRREAPELRIIPEALWSAAHARLRATVSVYRAASDQWGRGRPPGTPEGRYLLTGFLACASCGGSMVAWRRATGHGVTAYRCAYHHYRGQHVCANANTAPLATIEAAVLDGLRARVLAPEILLPAIREGIARFQQRTAPAPYGRRALEQQRAQLDRQLERLTTALAQGGSLPSILAKIQELEAAKGTLEVQLSTLTAIDVAAHRWSRRELERALQTAVTEWRSLLAGRLEEARHVLRQLLPERLRCTPRPEGGYQITGDVAIGGLVAAVADGSVAMVPPG